MNNKAKYVIEMDYIINSIKNAIKKLYYYIYNKTKNNNNTLTLSINDDDKILIVSPHPDDESIGCGGILSQYGSQCDILLMTDGRYGNPEWTQEYTISVRRKEFETAMESVGVKKLFYANAEDSHLSRHVKLPQILWTEYRYVFVPNRYEDHPDHRMTFQVIRSKLRWAVKRPILVEYEVWTPLIKPNKYFAMDAELVEKKCSLISNYACQLRHINYIDRIIGLNKYRGMVCYLEYAEAYKIFK